MSTNQNYKKKQLTMNEDTYNKFDHIKRIIDQKYGKVNQDKFFEILVNFAYNNSDKIVKQSDIK